MSKLTRVKVLINDKIYYLNAGGLKRAHYAGVKFKIVETNTLKLKKVGKHFEHLISSEENFVELSHEENKQLGEPDEDKKAADKKAAQKKAAAERRKKKAAEKKAAEKGNE